VIPVRRLRLRSPAWLRWPRRTARIRLTSLYGSLFLLSGAGLVAITYVLFERATRYAKPQLPQIPHAPAIRIHQKPSLKAPPLGMARSLQPSGNPFNVAPRDLRNVPLDLRSLARDQQQLAQFQSHLGLPSAASFPGPAQDQGQLAQDQHQLAQDQHQLAVSVHQLAQAVHRVAQAGSVEAVQRAADSHQLLVNSGIALAIVGVLALLAGWLVAGRMLRPIRTITRTAQRISSTSLHERLALAGPQDELKELGDTLDGLFERLEAAFEAQRHFVANASHELRTPLTAERTLLQVALDDPDTTISAWRSTAREVLASSDEQARLIEALLTLASSESGLTGREPVDLAAAVGAALVHLQPEIDRLGIDIDGAAMPAPLDGDCLLVERLIGNLLTNAVRHNVAGGRVEVLTRAKDGRAVLSVTNTGPLIPPAEVERLFQPFQRLSRRRASYKDGHGLGLSIVRAIAIAHNATITAQSELGGGLSVKVVFPQPANRRELCGGDRPSEGSGVTVSRSRRRPRSGKRRIAARRTLNDRRSSRPWDSNRRATPGNGLNQAASPLGRASDYSSTVPAELVTSCDGQAPAPGPER
jgi:signal transduction histidine kinase